MVKTESALLTPYFVQLYSFSLKCLEVPSRTANPYYAVF